MKSHLIPAGHGRRSYPLLLSSCETPAGQGAGIGAFTGAAAGALIGGAATGWTRAQRSVPEQVRRPERLLGAAIAEDQARYYHCASGRLSLCPERTGTPGYVYSPYGNHNMIDVRGVPAGALVRDPSTNGIFRNP